MTDQTIPADKVRDLRDQYARLIVDAGTKEARAYYGHVVDDLDALLPAPPRPTLADMTDDQRLACQWMQADVENRRERYVIANPFDEGNDAALIAPDGKIGWILPGYVTPRPDLPRMEWPSEAPVPPNTLTKGSEWDDTDALARACRESGRTQITVIDRDGDVSVWDESAENWHGPHPIPKYSPFTITHTGRKADQ